MMCTITATNILYESEFNLENKNARKPGTVQAQNHHNIC